MYRIVSLIMFFSENIIIYTILKSLNTYSIPSISFFLTYVFYRKGWTHRSSLRVDPSSTFNDENDTYTEKATFYKLTSNWSRFLFCTIACKKKWFRRRPGSMSDDVVEIRHWIRQWSDIDLRLYVAAGWEALASFHPTCLLAKGGSERRQSRFHRWLPRGMNPPSSLSRRCLVYLQWRRRDTHTRTPTQTKR